MPCCPSLPPYGHPSLPQGLDLGARKEVWAYLLGLYSPKHTTESKQAIYDAHSSSYVTLLKHCQELEVALQRHLGEEAATAAAQAVAAEADRVAAAAAATAAAEADAAAAATAAAVLGGQLDSLGTPDPQTDAGSNSPGDAGSNGSFTMLGSEVPFQPFGPDLTIPALAPRASAHAATLLEFLDFAIGGADGSGEAAAAGPAAGEQAASTERHTGGSNASSSGRQESGTYSTEAVMQYCDSQRMLVMDAIRSNFLTNSLTKVDELKSWWQR